MTGPPSRKFAFRNICHHILFMMSVMFRVFFFFLFQLMLQTHKFVMWMDSSIRFLTPDLDSLFAQAKKHGILAFHDVHLLPSHVHEDMFDFLQETPCLYRNFGEFSASLMLVHSDHQIAEEYIIRPWASCALVEHCIETKYPVSRLINCQSHKHYHSSHRYDQALLSILLYRLFHDSYSDHVIDQAYFRWCRSNNCWKHIDRMNGVRRLPYLMSKT